MKLGRRTTGGGNAIRAPLNASSHYYETTATLQTPWALTQALKARNFALTAMRYCTSWRDDPSPRSNDDCVSFLRALILDVRAARNALFEHDPMVFPNARASLAILEPSLPPGIIVQFSAQGTDLIVSAFSLAPCKATLGDDAIEVDDLYPFIAGSSSNPDCALFSSSNVNSQRTSIRQAHTFVVGKPLAYPDGSCIKVVDFEEVRFSIDAFSEVINVLSSAASMLEKFSRKRRAHSKLNGARRSGVLA